MSNYINSQNINTTNNITAFGKDFSRFIQAPQYTPEFNLSKALKERDEFRKQVTEAQNYQIEKAKNKPSKAKVAIILATIAGCLLFAKKK
ncbi:hypothetical protein IJ182_05150 [bacterium]|nr:hypothetical protein [bacterium]